ncbi:unnamed protein product [marine sediment metagenome]|uniref:Uncharacterized protein n=1 Tax=marine sediment metagenome TaxID=412755 RepID=X0VI36_9ZZZZ
MQLMRGEVARRKWITIINNPWSTPLYQNPLAMGIDVVVDDEETMQSIRGLQRSLLGGNRAITGS